MAACSVRKARPTSERGGPLAAGVGDACDSAIGKASTATLAAGIGAEISIAAGRGRRSALFGSRSKSPSCLARRLAAASRPARRIACRTWFSSPGPSESLERPRAGENDGGGEIGVLEAVVGERLLVL